MCKMLFLMVECWLDEENEDGCNGCDDVVEECVGWESQNSHRGQGNLKRVDVNDSICAWTWKWI